MTSVADFYKALYTAYQKQPKPLDDVEHSAECQFYDSDFVLLTFNWHPSSDTGGGVNGASKYSTIMGNPDHQFTKLDFYKTNMTDISSLDEYHRPSVEGAKDVWYLYDRTILFPDDELSRYARYVKVWFDSSSTTLPTDYDKGFLIPVKIQIWDTGHYRNIDGENTIGGLPGFFMSIDDFGTGMKWLWDFLDANPAKSFGNEKKFRMLIHEFIEAGGDSTGGYTDPAMRSAELNKTSLTNLLGDIGSSGYSIVLYQKNREGDKYISGFNYRELNFSSSANPDYSLDSFELDPTVQITTDYDSSHACINDYYDHTNPKDPNKDKVQHETIPYNPNGNGNGQPQTYTNYYVRRLSLRPLNASLYPKDYTDGDYPPLVDHLVCVPVTYSVTKYGFRLHDDSILVKSEHTSTYTLTMIIQGQGFMNLLAGLFTPGNELGNRITTRGFTPPTFNTKGICTELYSLGRWISHIIPDSQQRQKDEGTLVDLSVSQQDGIMTHYCADSTDADIALTKPECACFSTYNDGDNGGKSSVMVEILESLDVDADPDLLTKCWRDACYNQKTVDAASGVGITTYRTQAMTNSACPSICANIANLNIADFANGSQVVNQTIHCSDGTDSKISTGGDKPDEKPDEEPDEEPDEKKNNHTTVVAASVLTVVVTAVVVGLVIWQIRKK